MNVPDISGKQAQNPKTQKDADKKCLSFFVPIKKEGQSIFSYNLYPASGFSADSRKRKKACYGHVHFIGSFAADQVPYCDPMVGAQIYIPLRAALAEPDAYVTLPVIAPVLQITALL